MSWRFRRTFKIAPGVRLNLGKKSASVRVGGRGFGVTKSTTGQTTASVGIPGSGLYYRETVSGPPSPSSGGGDQPPAGPQHTLQSPTRKKRGWVKTSAIVTGTFIFGLILGSCGGGDNNAPYVEPTTVTSQGPPTKTSTAPKAVTRTTTAPKTSTASKQVYYANCTAVHAAGDAPIYRGEPGYSTKLDRDGDGVACDT